MANVFGGMGNSLYIGLGIAVAVAVLVLLLLLRARPPLRLDDEEPGRDAPLTRWADSSILPDDAEAPPVATAEGPHFATTNDLARLDQRAEHVLTSLRKKMPAFDFDEKSVQFLSDLLTAQRANIPPEDWEKFAPYYGAYLGKAILTNHRYLEGRWARDDGEWVLVFKIRDRWNTLSPAVQVRQHLQHGEEYSLARCYKGVHQLFKQ